MDLEVLSSGIKLEGMVTPVEFEKFGNVLGTNLEGPKVWVRWLTKAVQLLVVIDSLVNLAYTIWLLAGGRVPAGLASVLVLIMSDLGILWVSSQQSNLQPLYAGPQRLRFVSLLLPIVDILHTVRLFRSNTEVHPELPSYIEGEETCPPEAVIPVNTQHPWVIELQCRHTVLFTGCRAFFTFPLLLLHAVVAAPLRPLVLCVHFLSLCSVVVLFASIKREALYPPFLDFCCGVPLMPRVPKALFALVAFIVILVSSLAVVILQDA